MGLNHDGKFCGQCVCATCKNYDKCFIEKKSAKHWCDATCQGEEAVTQCPQRNFIFDLSVRHGDRVVSTSGFLADTIAFDAHFDIFADSVNALKNRLMSNMLNEKISSIEKIVLEGINLYGGGELFFSYIDHRFRNYAIVEQLLTLAEDHENVVISGNFGRFLIEYYKIATRNRFKNVTWVHGKLRMNKLVVPQEQQQLLRGKEWVLIDDSFFSGTTRDKIAKVISEYGGEFVKTFVVYDGSPEKDESVISLYRYYDHFSKEKGRLSDDDNNSL